MRFFWPCTSRSISYPFHPIDARSALNLDGPQSPLGRDKFRMHWNRNRLDSIFHIKRGRRRRSYWSLLKCLLFIRLCRLLFMSSRFSSLKTMNLNASVSLLEESKVGKFSIAVREESSLCFFACSEQVIILRSAAQRRSESMRGSHAGMQE